MDVPSYITIGGWFIQVIFDKYLSSKLQTWAAYSGIGDDLNKLRIAMLRIQSVLSCAEKIRFEGVLGWMKELRDVAYDAEDLLDELEYLRLQHQLDAKSSSPVSAFLTSNLETARDVTARAGGFLSSSFFNSTEGSNASNREAAGASSPCRLRNSRPSGTTPEMTWDRATRARIRTVIERLNQVGSCVNETITLFKLDRSNGGLNERTRKEASSSLISTRVFGREDEARELIDRLLKFDDEQVSVLPVVGTGGVGKTTLAQLVYNDPKTEEHFDLRMWVHVSDSFDDTELMREILECASDDSRKCGSIMNFNRVQVEIKRKLMWKRFLLVLDDVWSQESRSRLTEMEKWNKLLAPLKAGKSGSKILVTTRSRTVSEMLSTVSPINLKGLRDQDCCSLIRESACCDVDHEKQLKLEKLGNRISQKLKGLPLAAKAVARLLKNKLDMKGWNTALERNDIWDDIVPILKPSYHNLPAHLQRCFTYCSMFPRGWKFESDDLIYLWIAQGYIQPQNKNARMEDSGQDYMDDLLNRSFLEVHKKGFITHYAVDSTLHDLARYVSRDECIRVEGDEPSNLPPSVRHLSIEAEQYGRIKDVYQFHNLRTLILCGDIQSNLHNYILEDALNELKHIRALDLSNCKMDNIPATICRCIHLRYLDLSSTSIQLLPESLCKLYHLQVLNLTGCRLLNLPSGMKKLVNLRNLAASDDLISGVEEIGRLTSLQKLSVFRVRSREGYKIRELKYMNELQGSLQIRNLENVEGKEEANEAILNNKDRLHMLKFQWQSTHKNQPVDAEVLEGLQPHPNLKRLEIIGCSGATYPSWLATDWLTNLEVVYIRDCRCWECLPPLSQLPSLKILWVQGLHAMKRIGPELFGAGDKEFKWLKELVLDDMPELEQCLQDSQLFPRLQNIVIKDCNKLRTLPPLPPNLTELTVLNIGFWIPLYDEARMAQVASVVSSLCIYNCPALTASFCKSLEEEDKLSSLQTTSIDNTSLLMELIERKSLSNLRNLDINKCLEIALFTVEQEKKFEYLTALQSLSFSGCVNLQSLPQMQGLWSLEKLVVSDCPLIRSLPEKGLPSSLKVLEIESCHPLLKEWCRKRDGESWESIKHIPRIEIDGEVIYEYPSGN